jgi:hypothetical protein
MQWKFATSLLVILSMLSACRDNPVSPGDDPDPGANLGCAGGARSLFAGSGALGSLAGSGAGPTSTPGGVPVSLPVTGSGVVADRFSAEVAVNGDCAYTTSWGTRGTVRGTAIKIWNVSGAQPVVIDSLIIADAGTTSDVQISDDKRLLVVSTEHGQNLIGAINIYDLTTPAKPTLITHYQTVNTEAGVHTVKLGRIGGRHYAFLNIDPKVVGNDVRPARLVIVDITTPSAPTEVFQQAMGRPYIHDVFVRDGFLFAALWDEGMAIFDLGGGGNGSPQAPRRISTIVTKSGATPTAPNRAYVHNIWWFHDPVANAKKYAFVGEEGPASLFGFSSGDIHVVDVSDLTKPREVAFFNVPGAGTHNFVVDEPSGILYAAYYNGGVRALDIRGDLGTCTAEQKSIDGRCDLTKMGREAGNALTTQPVSIWGVALEGANLYASDMGATVNTGGLVKLNISALKR